MGQCTVAIIGGANSAGQAAVKLASNSRVQVYVLVRTTLAKGMSQYLIDRIHALDNVHVWENAEVEACEGKGRLMGIACKRDGAAGTFLPCSHMLVFIGAVPHTLWAKGLVAMDARNYVQTWDDAGAELPYETSIPGVFAAGDVRSGSTKRIASAIGEGAAAVQMIHRRLGT
jgi:thioredoxin reductase (NADPH)